MPTTAFHDWRHSAAAIQGTILQPSGEGAFELQAPLALWEPLTASLEDLLRGEHAEVRWQFEFGQEASSCLTYIKIRAGDSRFLLAHPEEKLWVSTLAFTPIGLREVLRALVSEGTVQVGRSNSALGRVGSVSNLEYRLVRTSA